MKQVGKNKRVAMERASSIRAETKLFEGSFRVEGASTRNCYRSNLTEDYSRCLK